MIERIKNIWAVLTLALSRQCDERAVLTEDAQQKLYELRQRLIASGMEMDKTQLEITHDTIATQEAWNPLIENSEIGAEEVARQISEDIWQKRVFEQKRGIRFDCFLISLFAAISISFWFFGPTHWLAFTLGALTAFVCALTFKLDKTRENEEFKSHRLEYLRAIKSGDMQKADELHESYMARFGQVLAKIDKFIDNESRK